MRRTALECDRRSDAGSATWHRNPVRLRPPVDRSHLAVLDAATLETVAEAHLPVRVPNGFHGSWIPAADLARA